MPLHLYNWIESDYFHYYQYQTESEGVHFQASPMDAAVRGWYYRRFWYTPLEPDTRRCRDCGEILFDAFTLTQAEAAIRADISTNVLLGEPPLP